MKRLRISIQVIVALLAISTTLAFKTGVVKSRAMRTVNDCYYDPPSAAVGNCVSPALPMSTDDCTEPENSYCCYTYYVCGSNVLVQAIILFRGS